MYTRKLFEYILEICQESAVELVKMRNGAIENRKTAFIFPQTSDGEIRVSEQEFRFVFLDFHSNFNYHNLFASVETPTQESYSFKGSGSRSAASDLSFWDQENKRICNIEFKAKNPHPATIEKDIEKLVREPVHGSWCHLLKNVNSGTIDSLFSKFIHSFNRYGPPKMPLFFAFILLEKQILISRKVYEPMDLSNPSIIFNLQYLDFVNLKRGKCFIKDWQIDIF